MWYLKNITIYILLHITGYHLTLSAQNSTFNKSDIYTNTTSNTSLYNNENSGWYLRLQKDYQTLKSEKDTVGLINNLFTQSEIKRKNGQYSLAFDHLWEGLFLAEESGSFVQEAMIHRRLADLYETYNMDSISLNHRMKAIKNARIAYQRDKANVEYLRAAYMEITVKHRKQGHYALALVYLDSCLKLDKATDSTFVPLPFTDAEKGYIMYKLGNYSEASFYLHRALAATWRTKPSYYGNIHMYLGDLAFSQHKTDSAIYYYNRGINYMPHHSKHYYLVPEAMIRLSEIYYAQKKFLRSNNTLKRAMEVKDSMVQVQNQGNSELFDVRNSYLQAMKNKDSFIQEQKDELMHRRQIQFRLQIILTLLILLGGVSVFLIRMRLKLRKTILEKKNTELNAKLKEERIEAKVEHKSKELTSYALQMIDKDTAIDELLEALKKDAPAAYKPLKSKYKKGSQDLWNNFNLRFTDVNSAFYERLNAKHPDLSPTERKHCALIKLNFGTKEMARILNIAPHSVHMSRSRIRKKLGLERADSLSKYIAGL